MPLGQAGRTVLRVCTHCAICVRDRQSRSYVYTSCAALPLERFTDVNRQVCTVDQLFGLSI